MSNKNQAKAAVASVANDIGAGSGDISATTLTSADAGVTSANLVVTDEGAGSAGDLGVFGGGDLGADAALDGLATAQPKADGDNGGDGEGDEELVSYAGLGGVNPNEPDAETANVVSTFDLRDPYKNVVDPEDPWLRAGQPKVVQVTRWLQSQIDAGYAKIVTDEE